MRQFLLPVIFTFLLLTSLVSEKAVAQNGMRVRGTILQSDKVTPIPGAGVIKLGSNLGVVSDADGNFLIDILPQDTLLIKAIGFKPILYLPQRLPVSEVRVNIIMQEDSVMLGEVEITSRPSEEMIQRALRNMKRTNPESVKNPGYVAMPEQAAPVAPPPPMITPFSLPIDAIYEMFSKEGKQNKKLQELLLQEELYRRFQEREKARREYNKLFKDNRGYE